MKCFYHLDDDGKCAAYLVHKHASNIDNYQDEFIRINYDIPLPLDKINQNEVVFIVDFSIPPEEMTELRKITPNIIWIDHHYTAILKNKGVHDDLPGIRYSENEHQLSGAMLTWIWFNHSKIKPVVLSKDTIINESQYAPLFIQYISDYDTWTHKFKNIMEFHAGMNLYENKEDFDDLSNIWVLMYGSDYDFEDDYLYPTPAILQTIKNGNTAIKFRDGWAKNYADNFSYEIEFEGYRCCVLQLQTCGSQWFKSQNNKGYDIYIACAYNGKEWITSLYSTTVDVGAIAMKYGGGGHKGAAGFHSPQFLFNKN